MEKTLIQIKMSTRDKLMKVGTMGETYDDLINRLLKLMEDSNKK